MDIETKIKLDDELKRIALKYADLYQTEDLKIEVTVGKHGVKVFCGDYRSVA